LVLPHNMGLAELRNQLSAGFAEGKQTIIAVGSIGLGLLFSVIAAILGMIRKRAD